MSRLAGQRYIRSPEKSKKNVDFVERGNRVAVRGNADTAGLVHKKELQMETLGTFKDVETAIRAVDSLITAGFAEQSITSLTSVPYPNGVIVKANQHTWFRWVSAGGGILGACAGFALAAGTAYLYPVQTGDKPIIALYPTGIITYELAMLFAMLGAIAGMFLEMRLPPAGERPYDPAIGEGAVGISVTVPTGDKKVQAEEIMREAGALRITT
jgi:hypothetical protein